MDMDVYNCIVPERLGSIVSIRQAWSFFVWLVDGEESWEGSCSPPGYTRAFGDGPRNFEPWSSGTPLLTSTPHQREDVSALDRFSVHRFPTRRINLSRATPSSLRIPSEDVLGYALVYPESSVQDISKVCSYSKSTVWNILHTYDAYPYRPVLAQELMPGDQERRFDFSNFVLNTLDENPDFFNEVLWSDERQFSRQGTINTQNTHYWSLENPHLIRPNRHQIRWKAIDSVSTKYTPNTTESPPNALVGECVVRNMEKHLNWPMYFGGPLTSESYMEILSGPLADFLEDEVSLRDLSRVWYQHDGDPTHKSAQSCKFLAQTFNTQIIGYGGQQEWPP
ncbi:uncharacterized protein TNCV_1981611 [Trichonephila clavipes]|nr:uncharacterized protein TNCV_1981611 [Trichonephila clavipes]